MPDFVTLTCPSCGGKLQVTQEMDRFACGYCGHEHIVKRQGGVVMLAPVVEGLRRVQVGTDKTAAELALVRLQKEYEAADAELQAYRAKSYGQVAPKDPVSQFMLAGAGIFLFFGICAATSNGGAAVAWIVVALICFGWWIHSDHKRTQKGKEIYDTTLAELQRRVSGIKSELERNRQMVRGS